MVATFTFSRHFRVGLDLAFGGRTEQRNYIEMRLSTPEVVKVMAKYYISSSGWLEPARTSLI